MNCKTTLRILPKWRMFLIMLLQGPVLSIKCPRPLPVPAGEPSWSGTSQLEGWSLASQAGSEAGSQEAVLHFSKNCETTENNAGHTMQRWKLNWRACDRFAPNTSKCWWKWPWDSRLLRGQRTSYPRNCRVFIGHQLSDLIWVRKSSFLKGLIIWGWELLTDKQITKWKREWSLLCIGAVAGSVHAQVWQPGKPIRETGGRSILPLLLFLLPETAWSLLHGVIRKQE